MSDRPLCSISLDVDDLWSYMKIRGDEHWKERPSYLPRFLPIALDTLESLGLRITFFVVGFDATVESNAPVLAQLVARGHEVGNHSFEHESWLHLYSRAQLEEEIEKAENAIAAATSQRPRGFRGPGYSWSETLLEVLAGRDYLYDASTLPTYLGPARPRVLFRHGGQGDVEDARAQDAVRHLSRWAAPRERVRVGAARRPFAARDPGHHDPRHQGAVPLQLSALPRAQVGGARLRLPAHRARHLPRHGRGAELPAASARSHGRR